MQDCPHPSLFQNMCVKCGMKVAPNAPNGGGGGTTGSSNQNSGYKLSMNMSGGKVLQLSAEEAASVTASKVSNLRSSKKLALVLDLDHTLLHAIQMEGQAPSRTSATARMIEGSHGVGTGEGKADNYVYHLPIEELDRQTVKHLVMKKRPHLDAFLERANEFCQMTVYTAGTRRYAEAVAKVIDPHKKYFGERIVSRCDVANIRADGNEKSLERIYPGDASMAVIIDDREDVWRGAQGAQLLLVKPFVHFDPRHLEAATANVVGGDNSSVPLADALNTISRGVPSNPATSGTGGSGSGSAPVIMSPVITLCAGNFETAGRIFKIAPLYSFEHSSADDQLPRCLQILAQLHAKYYHYNLTSAFDFDGSSINILNNNNDNNVNNSKETIKSTTMVASATASAAASAKQTSATATVTVAQALQELKKGVLSGCTITFSGLIPTNEENPRNHTLWRLAESLGAQV